MTYLYDGFAKVRRRLSAGSRSCVNMFMLFVMLLGGVGLWLGCSEGAIAQYASQPVPPPAAQAIPLQPVPTEPSGEALFTENCAACHANGGNIIRRGKTLKQKKLIRYGYDDIDAIASLVAQGKGAMPAYADRLAGEEIDAIAQYVKQQAAQGW